MFTSIREFNLHLDANHINPGLIIEHIQIFYLQIAFFDILQHTVAKFYRILYLLLIIQQ